MLSAYPQADNPHITDKCWVHTQWSEPSLHQIDSSIYPTFLIRMPVPKEARSQEFYKSPEWYLSHKPDELLPARHEEISICNTIYISQQWPLPTYFIPRCVGRGAKLSPPEGPVHPRGRPAHPRGLPAHPRGGRPSRGARPGPAGGPTRPKAQAAPGQISGNLEIWDPRNLKNKKSQN